LAVADTLRFDITQKPDFAAFERVLKAQRKPFYQAAMGIVVRDIVEGIASSRAIDGGAFPALERSTVMRKLHSKPLVDKGLLSDEFTYQQLNQAANDSATITIKPLTAPVRAARKTKKGRWTTRAAKGATRDTPRDIVGFVLQVEGLKNGKHFNFFGISKDAEGEILDLMQDVIALSLEAI